MRRKVSAAVVVPEVHAAPPPPRTAAPLARDEGAVDALRRRLASGTAREHVVLDFLEDDLREARTALAGIAAWIATVEGAIGDRAPSQDRILSLALGGRPGDGLDELATAIASVRKRLAQVAARM
jgi:hypothetical protein